MSVMEIGWGSFGGIECMGMGSVNEVVSWSLGVWSWSWSDSVIVDEWALLRSVKQLVIMDDWVSSGYVDWVRWRVW